MNHMSIVRAFPKRSIPVQVGVGSPYHSYNLAEVIPFTRFNPFSSGFIPFVGEDWGKPAYIAGGPFPARYPDLGLSLSLHHRNSMHLDCVGGRTTMARINIEDELFTDQLFADLIVKAGGLEAALGALVRLWLVAQKYWKKDKARIPADVWTRQRMNPALIETGWAELQPDNGGYYARGSERQFKWLLQKVEAGAAGGKASGESRHRDSDDLGGSDGKRGEAQVSETNPPTPTPPPSPVPSSPQAPALVSSGDASDDASAGAPKAKRTKRPKVEDPDAGTRREVWEAYLEAYWNRWEVMLERNAGINSMIKTLVNNIGRDAIPLVRFYVAHNEGQYVRACHPMTLCLRDYLGLRTQMLRGQAITTADIRQLEKTQQQVSQLENLRKVNL